MWIITDLQRVEGPFRGAPILMRVLLVMAPPLTGCLFVSPQEAFCDEKITCPAGYSCGSAGRCEAELPDAGPICPADAGFDVNADPANCGACGNACQSTEVCSSGVCVSNLAQWPIPPDVPPSSEYTITDGIIVTDNLTGLVWQRASPNGINLLQAQDYCHDLSLGSIQSGWRLPTIMELASLWNEDEFIFSLEADPAIDTTAFPATPATAWFWSSSPVAGVAGFYWTFYGGGSLGTSNFDSLFNTVVRCVHGEGSRSTAATPNGRYRTAPDFVYDYVTQLFWQRQPFTEGDTWSADGGVGSAQADCSSLEIPDSDAVDWRVPALKELMSIVDFSTYAPTLDQSIFGGGGGYYWSAFSTPAGMSNAAWVVSFTDGDTGYANYDTLYNVRCVNGAPNAG